jgi:GT2 family glycosyltransferase
MKKVIIGVITCRRPEWLKRLLDKLLTQNIDDTFTVTIAVVDNANDQATKQVVTERMSANPKIPLTYDVEETPGIVFARNRCVSIFKSHDADYLMFIDDDEWPEDDDWIAKMVKAVETYKTNIVTSHVISVGEPGTPEWAVELIYGNNKLKEGQVVDVFYTNNLLMTKQAVLSTDPCFDERFAMTGASDYHLALRCKIQGIKCIYTNAPVVEEFPKSRASVKWFCRRGFRSGIGYTRSHLFEESFTVVLLRSLMMTSIRIARALLKLLHGLLTMNKMLLVDSLFRFCSAAGTIAGFFGIKHEEYKVIHGK